MWDLIVSVPDHCLSFYFERTNLLHNIRNWLNGNLGVLWQCRGLIQECYICYLILLKYPLVQISVPKYPY